ncbi:SH3 domain-containing protein [Stutzerimonas azotifigens]|uniref:SH3 domain-containing protein n=1 Tax=Stutzerimonas azotifigens TaxID=291995 RepID=UPI001268435E|nr:SH3 domain-containing protein [Stutzerimonas azotifigens]
MMHKTLCKRSRTRIACLGVLKTLIALASLHTMAADEAEKAHRAANHIKFVVPSPTSLPVKACLSGECKTIAPSQDMLKSIESGYSEISLEDMTLDGNPEVVLTHRAGSNVNVCSEIFRYDFHSNSFTRLKAGPKQLCNYYEKDGQIISSYRSGAKWHEDIYSIKGDDFVLEASDSCVGCDHIERTIYLSGGRTEHLLVTDNVDYKLRAPLSTTVTSRKAILYEEPSVKSPTKMYLVKGDKVNLIEYTETENSGFWYKIKYINTKGKIIIAWLNCDDLQVCQM